MPESNVYNVDCMEYMKTIPDGFFDLALIDPPYKDENENTPDNKMKRYGDMKSFGNKPTPEMLKEFFRVSKRQIIWGYNYFADLLPNTNGFIFWYKHQPVKNYSDGELAWTSFLSKSVCFDHAYYGNINSDKNRIHPTQKPIALYKWLLESFGSSGGGKIFDSHLGSGSSRIAAYRLGFDFYACELNEHTFNLQEERFKKECCGEIKLPTGQILVQTSLF